MKATAAVPDWPPSVGGCPTRAGQYVCKLGRGLVLLVTSQHCASLGSEQKDTELCSIHHRCVALDSVNGVLRRRLVQHTLGVDVPAVGRSAVLCFWADLLSSASVARRPSLPRVPTPTCRQGVRICPRELLS